MLNISTVTDDDYAKTLREVMQDCLPPILVEVVEKRPLDPIAYIAEGLYRYRVFHIFVPIIPFPNSMVLTGNFLKKTAV